MSKETQIAVSSHKEPLNEQIRKCLARQSEFGLTAAQIAGIVRSKPKIIAYTIRHNLDLFEVVPNSGDRSSLTTIAKKWRLRK